VTTPTEELKALVLKRVISDQLDLPAMPAVAVKALQLLRSPGGSLGAVATVLENDPLVSARVLRLSNSAAYASRESAISVSQAVSRLGMRTLETILIEVSASGVFASKNKEINAACQQLWEHSLATGMLARDLSILVFGQAGQEFGQTAFLSGLLHDIGKPVLASVLLETEKKLAQNNAAPWMPMDAWLDLIAGAHRTVGLLVAAKWDMPALVRRGMTDLGEYEMSEPHSMRNFVRLANSLVKKAGIYAGNVSSEDLEAAIAAGCQILSLDPQKVQVLIEGLTDRVKQRIS
jgi:HD-like signal output (HDOD) protein